MVRVRVRVRVRIREVRSTVACLQTREDNKSISLRESLIFSEPCVVCTENGSIQRNLKLTLFQASFLHFCSKHR